jgi:hypothetical protein
VYVLLFQIIIVWYLKNDYKLKNILSFKSICLNLNKTIHKTSNISFLNKAVFISQASINMDYFKQFNK